MTRRGGERSILLRWGLIPFWAKYLAIGMRCINAMAETAAAKPAFRDAFRRRRCLLRLDGFYEWQKRPAEKKQPYAIVSADAKPFARSHHRKIKSFLKMVEDFKIGYSPERINPAIRNIPYQALLK